MPTVSTVPRRAALAVFRGLAQRSRPLALIALAGVLAGCGDTQQDSLGAAARTPASTPAPALSSTPSPAPSQARGRVVVPYLLRGERVAPVARTVAPTPRPGAAAIRALIAGPTRAERAEGLRTAVPRRTRLRGLSIHDGLATVDLSADFEAGGGSLSMQARVAQVVHTLTRFSTVRRVRFRIEGRPVSAIGGEGVIVSPPVDRADFEDLAPAILIEEPLPGRRVATPLRIRGTANTFEARFEVELIGAGGARLAKRSVTATSGTGTRGTFAATLRFRAATGTKLQLHAYEASAQDGRPIHNVRIRLVAGR